MGKFDLLNQLVPVVSDTHRPDTDIEKENERDTTAREEEEEEEEAEEADSFLDEKSEQSLTGKKRSVEKDSHGEEEEGRRSLVVVPGLERPPSNMVCMRGRAKRERNVAIPQPPTRKRDVAIPQTPTRKRMSQFHNHPQKRKMRRKRDVTIPQPSTKKKDAKKERCHNSTTTHNKERREEETRKDPPQPPTRKKDAKKGCGNLQKREQWEDCRIAAAAAASSAFHFLSISRQTPKAKRTYSAETWKTSKTESEILVSWLWRYPDQRKTHRKNQIRNDPHEASYQSDITHVMEIL
jgi:hypothetical protein